MVFSFGVYSLYACFPLRAETFVNVRASKYLFLKCGFQISNSKLNMIKLIAEVKYSRVKYVKVLEYTKAFGYIKLNQAKISQVN